MQRRIAIWAVGAMASLLALALLLAVAPGRAGEAHSVPAPSHDEALAPGEAKVAVLAGGCFWGVQGVFQHVVGVVSAVSGYDGGAKDTAHYMMTSRGDTGHAESVRVTYDPAKISYGRLLQIYFSVAHDPTELNYQGPDEGTQYRSAIFPQNPEQAEIAKRYIAELDAAKAFPAKIVTSIEPGRTFYPAEDYHQDYLTHNPMNGYIAANDMPKLEALKRLFPDRYREAPALVFPGT